MTTDYSIEWTDDMAVFRIQRPARLNAITAAVLDGITDVLDELEGGRGLVITGEGEKAVVLVDRHVRVRWPDIAWKFDDPGAAFSGFNSSSRFSGSTETRFR